MDTEPSITADSAGHKTESDAETPENWRSALMTLVSARIALIELEAKEAAKVGARRASHGAAAMFCGVFAWALVMAGGIAGLAQASGWPWFAIALGLAALHLVAAIAFARLAKSPGPAAFPVTRAEFIKDRQWIENFQNPRKSND